MPLDEILAEADAAERAASRRAAAERATREALAIRRVEAALGSAREALRDREPDLALLGAVVSACGTELRHLPPAYASRVRRAAAHILAAGSRTLDYDYGGPRSAAFLPEPLPKNRLPAIPSADDDDL